MNIDIYTVADILTGVFGAIMMVMLIDACCEKRKNLGNWVYIVGTLVLTVLINISNHVFKDGILNAVGMFFSLFLISGLYRGSVKLKAILSLSGFLLIGVAEILVLFAITYIYNVTVAEAVDNDSLRLLGVILSKMLTFAVISVFRIKVKKREYHMGTAYWLLFTLVFTISIVTVFLIYKLSYDIKVRYMYNLSVLCSFGLLFNTFFTLYLHEHMRKQTDIIHKQQQFEQQIKEQSKHLDEILVSQKQLKKFRHDFSNHLIALSNFYTSRDCDGGIKYIKSIDSVLQDSNETVESGNTAFDAIINSKKALALNKNTIFDSIIQIPEKMPIDAADICIIFGNALDNAIEACEKIQNEDRKISLIIIYESGAIFCKISNSALKTRNRVLETIKPDKENHGFGLENIRTVLAKYNSEPEIIQTDTEFTLKFIIFTNE